MCAGPCTSAAAPVAFHPQSRRSPRARPLPAAENHTTMQNLLAEAFNDLFAKYGKPEIAPKDSRPIP
jgi:hypothetical protein